MNRKTRDRITLNIECYFCLTLFNNTFIYLFIYWYVICLVYIYINKKHWLKCKCEKQKDLHVRLKNHN